MSAADMEDDTNSDFAHFFVRGRELNLLRPHTSPCRRWDRAALLQVLPLASASRTIRHAPVARAASLSRKTDSYCSTWGNRVCACPAGGAGEFSVLPGHEQHEASCLRGRRCCRRSSCGHAHGWRLHREPDHGRTHPAPRESRGTCVFDILPTTPPGVELVQKTCCCMQSRMTMATPRPTQPMSVMAATSSTSSLDDPGSTKQG